MFTYTTGQKGGCTPGKVQMVVNVKKVDISDGRFERFLLLVFASLVDAAGKILFYQKRIIKIMECQAIKLDVYPKCS